MTSTIFDKNAYDSGIRDAIGTVTDDWGFRFPGIHDVEPGGGPRRRSSSPVFLARYLRLRDL